MISQALSTHLVTGNHISQGGQLRQDNKVKISVEPAVLVDQEQPQGISTVNIPDVSLMVVNTFNHISNLLGLSSRALLLKNPSIGDPSENLCRSMW